MAILPFYVSLGVDLRSVRALRLLRLLRILKLARYSSAIGRFQRALTLAREELLVFLGIAVMLIYLSAVGIYYFENEAQPEQFASVFHSLWWAVVTLTTVGYGDAFPVTLGGRMFTFAVLMAGLGIVAVPTGLLASALARVREWRHLMLARHALDNARPAGPEWGLGTPARFGRSPEQALDSRMLKNDGAVF